jgi:ADP-ribose pyrophosphatase
MKKWELLSSKYLFTRKPWLTIREDRVKLNKGLIMDCYYVFEYPDWATVLAIDTEGYFIMIQQYRHALGEISYELSAGVCEDEDQDHLASAQRELLEETGYGGGEWKLWTVNSANPGTHTNLTYCYIAVGVEKIQEQKLDGTEEISVHRLSKAEVLELLERNQIRQSLHAAALWKYIAQK